METEKVSESNSNDEMHLQQQIVEHMHKLSDSSHNQKHYSGIGPFSEKVSSERNSLDRSLEKNKFILNTERDNILQVNLNNNTSRERIRSDRIKLETLDSHEDHFLKWQKDLRKSPVSQNNMERAAKKIQKFFRKMLRMKQKMVKNISKEKFEKYETGSFGKYELSNSLKSLDKAPYGGL